MVAHFTMRTHGVNQAFRFVEGIWLHRKSHQIRFFFREKILFSSYVRNVKWASILYKSRDYGWVVLNSGCSDIRNNGIMYKFMFIFFFLYSFGDRFRLKGGAKISYISIMYLHCTSFIKKKKEKKRKKNLERTGSLKSSFRDDSTQTVHKI